MARNDRQGGLLSRREVLKGSAAAAGVSMVAGTAAAVAATQNGAPSSRSVRQDEQSDLALVNGKILTLDGRSTIAAAIAIRDGRVAQIGKQVGRCARTIDLKGATVIPGLIDAHNHIYWAFSNPGHEARDVELAASMRELLQAIADRARTVPAGEVISCNGGWSRNGVAEKRLPTLAELDAAAPNHPVWMTESQTEATWIDPKAHPPLPAVTNTRGLAFFAQHGVKGDAATGQISWLDTTAALMKLQTEADRKRSIDAAIDFAVGLGVTMIHDFGDSTARDGSIEAQYPYVIDMWRARELKLRFRLRLGAARGTGLEGLKARMVNSVNRLGDDVLRLNGFGEGLGEGTQASFVEAAKLVAAYGWSAHVHSVSVGQPGDITQNLEHTAAYKAANAEHSIKNLRWSLAHVNYLTPELTQQLKAIGVGVTGDAWQYCSEVEPVPMGPPWRMLLDCGIPIGAGSDGTGTAGFNPWLTIYYMTTGRINSGAIGNPGQTISRLEALKIHTLGSAWHSFDEEQLGSLEVGKLADLAVLSDDVLSVSDANLRRITSKLTLQSGRIVHQST